MIKDTFAVINSRIKNAAERSGRMPSSVALIGVSKGRALADIQAAVSAGVVDIGESRVQEALLKYNAFSSGGAVVRWHMIGHLQTNKVKEAVRIFDLIHSVDSVRLAQAIDKEAQGAGKIQEVLLEVKTSPEAAKYGIPPEKTEAVLHELAQFRHLYVRGLMTIAPFAGAPDEARVYFRQLKSLFDAYNRSCAQDKRLKELSMGMSDDFEAAIEEGSTMVRIGRALFDQ
jgi:PLP dependent protein